MAKKKAKKKTAAKKATSKKTAASKTAASKKAGTKKATSKKTIQLSSVRRRPKGKVTRALIRCHVIARMDRVKKWSKKQC